MHKLHRITAYRPSEKPKMSFTSFMSRTLTACMLSGLAFLPTVVLPRIAHAEEQKPELEYEIGYSDKIKIRNKGDIVNADNVVAKHPNGSKPVVKLTVPEGFVGHIVIQFYPYLRPGVKKTTDQLWYLVDKTSNALDFAVSLSNYRVVDVELNAGIGAPVTIEIPDLQPGRHKIKILKPSGAFRVASAMLVPKLEEPRVPSPPLPELPTLTPEVLAVEPTIPEPVPVEPDLKAVPEPKVVPEPAGLVEEAVVKEVEPQAETEEPKRHESMGWAGADWVRGDSWAARVIFDRGNFPLIPSARRHEEETPGVTDLSQASSDLSFLSAEALIHIVDLDFAILLLSARYDFSRSQADYPLFVSDPERPNAGTSRSVSSLSTDHAGYIGAGLRFLLGSDALLFVGGRAGAHYDKGRMKVTAPHGLEQEIKTSEKGVPGDANAALDLNAAFHMPGVYVVAGINNDPRYRFYLDGGLSIPNWDARDIALMLRARQSALPSEAPRSYDPTTDQATYSTGALESATVNLDVTIPIPGIGNLVDPNSFVPSIWLLGELNVADGQDLGYGGGAGVSFDLSQYVKVGAAYGLGDTLYLTLSILAGPVTTGSSDIIDPSNPQKVKGNSWFVLTDGLNSR